MDVRCVRRSGLANHHTRFGTRPVFSTEVTLATISPSPLIACDVKRSESLLPATSFPPLTSLNVEPVRSVVPGPDTVPMSCELQGAAGAVVLAAAANLTAPIKLCVSDVVPKMR